MKTNESAHIAVLGLGYVGCVSAACLAELGHTVVGVDPDPHKVSSVEHGRAPFHEPGLEPLIRRNREAGRLTATSSLTGALRDSGFALVCVGTPSERNGNLGLEQLRQAAAEIARIAPGLTRPLTVAIRSTVFPGTCEDVVMPALGNAAGVRVVSNPEFLREGSAVKDFFEPSLLVVGGEASAAAKVAALYRRLPVEPCLVSLRTAELIKYACNAFHAVKVSFANEIGALASRLGIDGDEVMDTLCRDVKLNVSPAYLKPGFAFGGSCLPKDLRALCYRAQRLDLSLPLLASTLPSNAEHLARAVQAALDSPARRIGIFGLAFKEDTDDLRESPVVALIETLLGKGRDLRVHDPHIRIGDIYGSNRRFVLRAVPHIEKLMMPELSDLLSWPEALIVAQKPSVANAEAIERSGLPVLDLVGAGLGHAGLWRAALQQAS